MADIKDRAREYLAEHSEYSEVFGQTFVAVDTLTAMVEFAEQETKDLEKENERLKGDLELWESGACRATNLDTCGVVAELKAQIEKMKCCANCKHSRTEYEHCRTNKHEKWEIKEND